MTDKPQDSLVEQLIARRADMRLLSAGEANLGIALARARNPEVILMGINLPVASAASRR